MIIQWLKCTKCGFLYDNSGREYPRPAICDGCRPKPIGYKLGGS